MLLPNLVKRGAIISFTKGVFGFAHAKGPNDSLMKWMAQSHFNALNLHDLLTSQKQLKLEHWTTYKVKSTCDNSIHLALIDYLDENGKFLGQIDVGQERRIGLYSPEELDELIPIKDKQVEDWLFATKIKNLC
jgi:hypothetical protein